MTCSDDSECFYGTCRARECIGSDYLTKPERISIGVIFFFLGLIFVCVCFCLCISPEFRKKCKKCCKSLCGCIGSCCQCLCDCIGSCCQGLCDCISSICDMLFQCLCCPCRYCINRYRNYSRRVKIERKKAAIHVQIEHDLRMVEIERKKAAIQG